MRIDFYNKFNHSIIIGFSSKVSFEYFISDYPCKSHTVLQKQHFAPETDFWTDVKPEIQVWFLKSP